jgi:hypothetical protein
MLKQIGYIPPKNKDIELFHREFFAIIKNKVSDISKIICACCCTMNDKNGESLGVFFTLPDRFVYVAAIPDKKHMIYEEFIIDKISNFMVLAQDKQIYSIKFQIYKEDVIVRGYKMKISNDFIQRLKSSGIILFDLNSSLN